MPSVFHPRDISILPWGGLVTRGRTAVFSFHEKTHGKKRADNYGYNSFQYWRKITEHENLVSVHQIPWKVY